MKRDGALQYFEDDRSYDPKDQKDDDPGHDGPEFVEDFEEFHDGVGLRKAGVPTELHVFENGAHGLGLAMNDAALSEWPKLLLNWMRGRKLVQ